MLAAAAGLPLGELGAAQDALIAAGLLAEDGMRFAHGLIATVIAEDLRCTERERLHGEAARALMAVRADPRLIAGHLLRVRPQADPAVSACLQDAARLRSRRPPRPISSARSPNAHPATTAGGCSRGSAPSATTPGCRMRAGICARRCARCPTARAGSPS